MAHYGNLADYQFKERADDIRGATLYGANQEKLGEIKDVIFDHPSGDIRYLVVDSGKGHIAVPADHVFRSMMDEDSFAVDMTAAQMERLPDFTDEYLQNEDRWSEFHSRQEESLKDWRADMERKYKQGGWHEGPVQHRRGSTHNITPEPGEMAERRPEALRNDVPPAGLGSLGEEIEPIEHTESEPAPSGEGFTPHRLAGKFPDTAQSPEKIAMHPQGAREERVPQSYSVGNQNMPGQQGNPSEISHVGDVLDTSREAAEERRALYSRSERWDRFEDLLRRNRVDITAKCPSCAPARDKAA